MKEEKDVLEAAKYRNPILIDCLKKGDYLFCKSLANTWICIVSHIEGGRVHFLAYYNLKAKILRFDDWFLADYIERRASLQEIYDLNKIFDENNLLWHESERKIIDLGKLHQIPDTIGIFHLRTAIETQCKVGDGLFIQSNTDDNLLFANTDGYGKFKNNQQIFERVECKLVGCEYKELKSGDTAFFGVVGNNKDILKYYVKIIDKDRHIFLYGENIVVSASQLLGWYKVVSIS